MRKLVQAVKGPVEAVLVVCTLASLGEHAATPLLSIDSGVVHDVSTKASTLSVVLAFGRILFSWKEHASRRLAPPVEWEHEAFSSVSRSPSAVSGLDRVLGALIVVVTTVLGMQTIGYDASRFNHGAP